MKKATLITITSLLAIAVLFLVSVYGFGFLQRETADFRGETGQIEDTKANSDYRIASYDSFYDSCASVQSIESKIVNMQDELEETDEVQRETVLKTSITAAKNKRAELISSYNADARKEATQGQFRASDLPYELNENEEETICEAY
ncbi:hypothetical protein JOC34_000568 [Virgibacillus halotolerans]|uniref:hypothetical protein n=1 Tax=Virgibacillus halotolerans TaxID=1071053 RepID=UPI0019610858|nr:hypothetical protein [Virgibacillus halotolerans]MBM7598211.1 hypothetical protein [Virgibacillus halotolerans]